MKKALLVAFVVLVAMSFAVAQSFAPTTDVLGAHQNGGRGCAGCHAPHSGSRGAGQAGGADSGNYALWGQDVTPMLGQVLSFGDVGARATIEVLPASLTAGTEETSGVLLCLSCHDGNLTKSNMMAKQSYEQVLGTLPTTYGSQPIPTLLGNDGSTAGNYNNDHPVGINAVISTGNGLVSTAGVLTVTTGSNYAQFVANYGWPALAPGKYSKPYGQNVAANTEYVVCTTCHNQHVMNVYTSTAASPIVADGGGSYYATYFFVNGPYNPGAVVTNGTAASTTQFCRQCHFGEANEANNALTIKTTF